MKLLLLATALFSFGAFAGAGSSGGGDIDDLRRYHSLPEEKIKELLTTKSYQLKKMAVDMLRYNRPKKQTSSTTNISTSSDEKNLVETFYEAVDNLGEDLTSQLILSANLNIDEELFKTHCASEGYRAACTTNDVPGSTIYFSIKRLVIKDTSLSELAGLFMHELTHWYVGEADDKNFEVGAYFEEIAREGSYKTKTFTLSNGDLFWKKDSHWKDKYYFWLADFSSYGHHWYDKHKIPDASKLADTFCKKKGYSVAKSFSTTRRLPVNRNVRAIGVYYDELGNRDTIERNSDSYKTVNITVFSAITCR